MAKQEFSVEKEDAYVVLPTTEDELVFAIAVRENDPDDPRLLYDGDEHALLLRGEKEIILLDYLNSEVQNMLKRAQSIFIAEIDYKDKLMVRDYAVPVQRVVSYPVDIEPFFD